MTATRKRQQTAAPEAPDPVEGGYRCTECGHGEKLWAYAGANVMGPLAADGDSLSEHEAVEEWGIHEDSITCREHPCAPLERFVGGQWCRWWSCPRCHGGGVERWGAPYGQQYSKRCDEETPFPARPVGTTGQSTTHEGWLPAA